jgi:hypothetical protein
MGMNIRKEKFKGWVTSENCFFWHQTTKTQELTKFNVMKYNTLCKLVLWCLVSNLLFWLFGAGARLRINKVISENGEWLSPDKPIANEQWNHIRFLLQRETCGNQKNHREIRDCCNICSPRTTLLRYDGPLPWQKKLPGREAFFLSTRIDFWRKPKPFQVGAKISN